MPVPKPRIQSEYVKRKRAARKKLGLCCECGAEAVPGRSSCARCLEQRAECNQTRLLRLRKASHVSTYVAGPYSHVDDDGIRTNIARALSAGLALVALGHKVIVPHVAVPAYYDWDRAMRACKRLLSGCKEVVLLPDWETSRGACQERIWADELGIPVLHFADVAPGVVLA